MGMVGRREEITGEELLRRYGSGERDFPFIYLDHGNCVLEGADLSGINLMASNMEYGSFHKTNLSKARLIGAILPADMGGANLSGADLTGAMLKGVWFQEADLTGCVFDRAILSDAIFKDAILHYTNWKYANLIDADFTGAIGFPFVYPASKFIRGGNGYGFVKTIFWDTTLPDGSIISEPFLSHEE
jgi:hypothetical protein